MNQNTTIIPIIQEFVEFLVKVKRRSPMTAKCYRFDVMQFVQFLMSPNQIHDADVDQMTALLIGSNTKCMTEYVEWEKKRCNPMTVCRRVAALRSFFAWLHHTGQIEVNPSLQIHVPFTRKSPERISEDLITKLLAVPEEVDDFVSRRDRAILELLRTTGVMLCELHALNRGDIDDDCARLSIKRRRGGSRSRDIKMESESARTSLKRYLRILRAREPVLPHCEARSPLFVNFKKGSRLSLRSVRRVITKYVRKAEILDHGVSPRTIRNSFATHMLASGVDVQEVKAILGHQARRTTIAHAAK